MAQVLTEAVLLKELAVVDERLAAAGITTEKRLALLRRQADLGDLRDALAARARHQAQ